MTCLKREASFELSGCGMAMDYPEERPSQKGPTVRRLRAAQRTVPVIAVEIGFNWTRTDSRLRMSATESRL